MFDFNFSKANTKVCLNLHYNDDNSYLFVNGKEIFRFKADNKNIRHIKQSTIKTLISKISTRALGLEFKSDKIIKSKTAKFIIKNIAWL